MACFPAFKVFQVQYQPWQASVYNTTIQKDIEKITWNNTYDFIARQLPYMELMNANNAINLSHEFFLNLLDFQMCWNCLH